jgi:DNA-binding beta-propeller fold protein YncE
LLLISFAGGFVVQSFAAYWFYLRYGVQPATLDAISYWANTFEAKVVQSIKGLNEPQGVLYVPGLDKIFVANAGSGAVKVYDGKTYALRKSIELGAESDTDNRKPAESS